MIPHKQLFTRCEKFPDIPGDCLRTVVASILDLPLESVPHFVHEYGDAAWVKLRRWLRERMIVLTRLEGHVETQDYCMFIGPSPRDQFISHAVVGIRGDIVHDPHPDDTKITDIHHTYTFTPQATDWSRYAPLRALECQSPSNK
jgi:hypothetical protein